MLNNFTRVTQVITGKKLNLVSSNLISFSTISGCWLRGWDGKWSRGSKYFLVTNMLDKKHFLSWLIKQTSKEEILIPTSQMRQKEVK